MGNARACRGRILLFPVLVLLIGIRCESPTVAANVTFALTAPPSTLVVSNTAGFWLNALNTSTQQVAWSFPAEIQCRLASPQLTSSIPAVLKGIARDETESIAPGAFARREYVLRLPPSTEGQIIIEMRDFPGARLALYVQQPPPVENRPAPTGSLLFYLKGRRLAQEAEVYSPDSFFKEHIFGYQPFYFIAGGKSPNAKFQISFKYRLLNDYGWLAQKEPWLTGFYVAYTQMSLWDWNGPSAPFYDTSYMPEFLYSWHRAVGRQSTNWFHLDFEGGFHHESNGKAGGQSRSMNLAYLRPTLVLGRDDGLQLSLTPRVWAYLGDLNDNPDIAEYRGYADLRAVLGWRRGLEVSALGRMGKDANHGSMQIDATYPLMQPPYGSFSLYLDVQYFTGYGESLLGYRQRTDIFRAGIAIYR